MKINIYNEVIEILNEYELLLNKYNNTKNNINNKNDKYDKNNIQKSNVYENVNEFVDNDFLYYIFNNIKIKKKDDNDNIKNNLDNDLENNLENDLKNDINNDSNNNHNTENNTINNTQNNRINNTQNNTQNNTENNIKNYNNTDNDNNLNNTDNDNNLNNKDSEILIFIRKYYKKIVILTHPDKTNDIMKNEIFKKAKYNLENIFLIGIIKNCYDLKIEIKDLTNFIFNHIMFEIRVIQEKIIELRRITNIL